MHGVRRRWTAMLGFVQWLIDVLALVVLGGSTAMGAWSNVHGTDAFVLAIPVLMFGMGAMAAIGIRVLGTDRVGAVMAMLHAGWDATLCLWCFFSGFRNAACFVAAIAFGAMAMAQAARLGRISEDFPWGLFDGVDDGEAAGLAMSWIAKAMLAQAVFSLAAVPVGRDACSVAESVLAHLLFGNAGCAAVEHARLGVVAISLILAAAFGVSSKATRDGNAAISASVFAFAAILVAVACVLVQMRGLADGAGEYVVSGDRRVLDELGRAIVCMWAPG